MNTVIWLITLLQRPMKFKSTLLLLMAAFITNITKAQQPINLTGKALYSTIIAMDKKVFDAYNSCNLDEFEKHFTKDVEFFNDRTGYTESRSDLMKSMRSVCDKGGMERRLVSARVYLLDFYGAVETGTQRFYKIVDGKKVPAGSSQFMNIWKLDDGEWKIARVVSYEHKD
jgi:hypothetical protein